MVFECGDEFHSNFHIYSGNEAYCLKIKSFPPDVIHALFSEDQHFETTRTCSDVIIKVNKRRPIIKLS